jgi:hypothetical protein
MLHEDVDLAWVASMHWRAWRVNSSTLTLLKMMQARESATLSSLQPSLI